MITKQYQGWHDITFIDENKTFRILSCFLSTELVLLQNRVNDDIIYSEKHSRIFKTILTMFSQLSPSFGHECPVKPMKTAIKHHFFHVIHLSESWNYCFHLTPTQTKRDDAAGLVGPVQTWQVWNHSALCRETKALREWHNCPWGSLILTLN